MPDESFYKGNTGRTKARRKNTAGIRRTNKASTSRSRARSGAAKPGMASKRLAKERITTSRQLGKKKTSPRLKRSKALAAADYIRRLTRRGKK